MKDWKFFLNNEDVSNKIRTPDISMKTSFFSWVKFIRDNLLPIQRNIASWVDCILDWRDIWTVVFPNAELKFYLDASAEVRAKRRYEELKINNENISFDEVLEDVEKRDHNDKTKAHWKLKIASDAFVIDSSNLTINEVLDIIEGKILEIKN